MRGEFSFNSSIEPLTHIESDKSIIKFEKQ